MSFRNAFALYRQYKIKMKPVPKPPTTGFVELTPLDEAMCRIYVRLLLFFPFESPKEDLFAVAEHRIGQALRSTVQKWPMLAGKVGPHDNPEKASKGHLQVKIELPEAAAGLPEGLCNTRNVAQTAFLSLFNSSSQQSHNIKQAPPLEFCDKELFTLSPNHPKDGETLPVMTLAVNFPRETDDGLILGFAFHHAALDGPSIKMVLAHFARSLQYYNSYAGQILKNAKPLETIINGAPFANPFPTRPSLEFLRSFQDVDASSLSEYDGGEAVEQISEKLNGGGVGSTCRMFTFDASFVSALKTRVNAYLEGLGKGEWVSTMDCLCGLIWLSVIRVRFGRLNKSLVTKFATAIDCRRRLEPPLPQYFGNLLTTAVAATSVAELVGGDEALLQAPQTSEIAKAALLIRQAISTVDNDYIARRYSFKAEHFNALHAGTQYKRAIDMANYGLDFSSWVDWIGDGLNFDIPGTTNSRPLWTRKTWSANPGAVNIMPREGTTQGSAPWEVLLGLSGEDMDRVCMKTELGSLVVSVVG